MNKPFGIGAGLLIAMVTLVIRIPYLAAIVFSWGIVPLHFPVIGEVAGYYGIRKIIQTWRWPDDPKAITYAAKWIAILTQLLSALAITLICLGLYFTFFPLLIIPPTSIGTFFTTRLLVRSFRQPKLL